MSFSINVETTGIDVTAWRIMTGMHRCSLCMTYVGSFRIMDDNDQWTGRYGLLEMSEPPVFGTEHTIIRCESLRIPT